MNVQEMQKCDFVFTWRRGRLFEYIDFNYILDEYQGVSILHRKSPGYPGILQDPVVGKSTFA